MRVMYDERGIPEGIDWELKGRIKVGEKFVWEPLLPYAREELEVMDFNQFGDGENWIKTRSSHGVIAQKNEFYFRRGCVRLQEG